MNDKKYESDCETGRLTTAASFSGEEMKERKALKHHKLPSYATELIFVTVNMVLVKLFNEKFFDAMTFFLLSVPLLGYFFVTLAGNLW